MIRILVSVSAAIIICIVLGLVIRTQGFVSGSEFAPSHFVRRSFSFYEIPLFHWQITPIRRSDDTPPTATYVKTRHLRKLPKGAASNWHLISLTRGISGTTNSDAYFLLAQLEFVNRDKTDPYWIDWSKQNPKHAAVLWPIIQRLAERELYIFIPMIFATADAGDKDPTELQRVIDEQVAEKYASLINDMREAGRLTIAAKLLSEALADYPNHPDLQRLGTNK